MKPEVAAAELLQRRAARLHLEDFCAATHRRYLRADHHREVCQAIDKLLVGDILRLIIEKPPRHGKALAVDTPVPTPTGWSAIGDLRVGDAVFDDLGRVCRVTWVSPTWKDRPVYEIRTDDGESIIADEEHEWPVVLCRKKGTESIHTSKYLAKPRRKKPMVRCAGPLDLPQIELPVDPYILGYWLGDGTHCNGGIAAHVDDQPNLCRQAERAGYRAVPSKKNAYRVWIHGLRGDLVRAGVLGNKHIPAQYLRASERQRRELLAGLIDSDGYVAPDGQVEFCSIDKGLADSVRELVWSLGVKASIILGTAKLNGVSHGTKYRVMFYMAFAAQLQRKVVRCHQGKRATRRYITSTPAGTADTVCIEVDSPTHLFLAGRAMVPTHNSYHVSERLPALFLGRYPDRHIITASHGDKMARRFGRKVRNIVGSAEYQQLFPGVVLNPRVDAADEFETMQGGRYIASGINGGYMGAGAHLLGIDDPFKSRADAESQIVRDSVWTSFSDLESRMEPGCVTFVQHTRWHEDDLIGRIRKERIEAGIEYWTIITQPLILNECERWEMVEKGQGTPEDLKAYEREHALWDERYGLEACRAIRRKKTRRDWVSLYQQKPSSKEGDVYRREWFERYDVGEHPKSMNIYVVSDFATKKDDGDWTEFYVIGIDCHSNVWFIGAWFGQEQTDVWIPALVEILKQNKPHMFFGEGGQIRASIEPFLKIMMESEKVFVPLEWMPPIGDKHARSRGFRGLCSMHKVFIPNCNWGERFIDHHCAFPTTKMDHCVDASSLVGRAFDEAVGTMKPPEKVEEKKVDRWSTILNRDESSQSWMLA